MRNSQRVNEVLEAAELHGDVPLGGQIIARGGGPEDFITALVQKRAAGLSVPQLAGLDLFDLTAGATYSYGRAIQDVYRDAAGISHRGESSLERDISDRIKRGAADGYFSGTVAPIAFISRRDFNAGTASEAGNLAGGGALAAGVVSPLRAALALGRLGVTYGTARESFSAPRWVTLPSGESRTEVQAASDGSATTATETIAPTRYAAKWRCSRRAVLQAPALVDAQAREELRRQIIVPIEAAAIAQLQADSDIPTIAIGANGGAMTRAKLVEMEATASVAGADAAPTAGWLANPAVRSHLRRTESAAGSGFLWPDAGGGPLGYRAEVTTNVPANLTKASGTNLSALFYSTDWSHLWIVYFGAAAVDISIDPVSRAAEGEVVIRAAAYVGTAVVRPGSFTKCVDIVTT